MIVVHQRLLILILEPGCDAEEIPSAAHSPETASTDLDEIVIATEDLEAIGILDDER